MPSPPPNPPRSYHAVRWFLSVVILRRLKQLTGTSLFANELDTRNWMAWPDDLRFDQGGEVWFDYLADTGDDSRVMEALGRQLFQPFTTEAGDVLPRGDFVVFGGDTAYVVADQTTIWQRVVAPFGRALAAVAPTPDKLRAIVGVPGNHDYYDNLAGFHRMFRKRPPADLEAPSSDRPTAREPLPLAGFHRIQDASFLRMRLPGDWQLWGADFWNQPVDDRQQAYFRPDGAPPPRNLILCTPTPPIVLGGYLASDTDRESYRRLLGPGFDVAQRFAGDNPADQRLVMLSGDTHHYERYQGDRTVCVVSGGGGAFIHPTEHDAGSYASAVRYPDRETSRARVASALAWGLPTMIRAGLLWLVGGLLGALTVDTLPTPFVALPGPALILWGLVAAGGLVAYAAHRITDWVRTQRLRSAPWQLRPPDRTPDPAYLALRDTAIGRKLSELGVLDDAGMILQIAAGISPAVLPYLLRGLWLPGVTAGSVVFVGTAAVMIGGLAFLGASVGAEYLGWARKVLLGALGAAHGAIQLALPIAAMTAVSAGWYLEGAIVLAGWAGFALAGRALYHRGAAAAVALLGLWLAQGAALPYLVWHHGGTTALIGIASGMASWRAILGGAVIGALVAPLQFAWYLLVAGSFEAHNNEIGSALRSTQHKQWIRFQVTPARVTGYVIAIDDPAALAGGSVVPRVIDRFSLDAG